MNWIKIDDTTYTLKDYIIKKLGWTRWSLSCSQGFIGEYQTLKQAKSAVQYMDREFTQKSARKAVLKAFNGTIIGEFDIVYENDKILVISTTKGNMKFDKKVGVQAGTKKDVFSNTIEKI